MKTEPRIKSTHLILILALTAAIVSQLGLVNLSKVQAQTVPAVMVIIYTGIPESFTLANLQAMPQFGGNFGFYQTQQKQVNNGFWMEVSPEGPTPAHLESPARAQPTTLPSPTPTNAATLLPNETQGTITFIAVSAATLILAAIAFAWILKRTKKPPQKRVRLTTQT